MENNNECKDGTNQLSLFTQNIMWAIKIKDYLIKIFVNGLSQMCFPHG